MSKSRSAGTKLKIGIVSGSSTATMQVVGALDSISGVSLSADTIDITTMDNQDGYREFKQNFKEGGEVPVSGFLDGADAGQGAMYDAFEDGAVHTFAIDFPAAIGKSWTFNGIVTNFSTSAAVDKAVTFEATIKVSGKPVLADTVTGAAG